MLYNDPLHRLIDMFNRGRGLDFAQMFSENISMPEYVILSISLHMKNTKGKICVSDIVKEFDCSAPAISKHLRSCEEKGYIERSTDKDDRRNTVITITERGQKAFNKSFSELMTFNNRLFEKISLRDFSEWINKAEHFRVMISDTIEELRVR